MKFLKGTKLNSIIEGSCPVCQSELMYSERNPYKIRETLKMNERCSVCNTKYKMEPSFFFGAMYVSYPVGLFFGGLAFVLFFLVLNLNLITTYWLIVLTMVLLLPIILRLSRNIWINFFKSYKEISH